MPDESRVRFSSGGEAVLPRRRVYPCVVNPPPSFRTNFLIFNIRAGRLAFGSSGLTLTSNVVDESGVMWVFPYENVHTLCIIGENLIEIRVWLPSEIGNETLGLFNLDAKEALEIAGHIERLVNETSVGKRLVCEQG